MIIINRYTRIFVFLGTLYFSISVNHTKYDHTWRSTIRSECISGTITSADTYDRVIARTWENATITFLKTQRTRARGTRALDGQKTQVLRDGPLHLAGYGPKDTRRLGAGVSVHLTYDDDNGDGRIGILIVLANSTTNNEQTNLPCACIRVGVRMYVIRCAW